MKLLSDFLCLTQALPSARSFFPFVGAPVRRSNLILVIFLCRTSQNWYMYFYLGLSGAYISHSSNSLSIVPLNQLNSDIEPLSHTTCLAGISISVTIKVFFLSHGSIYESYVAFQEKGRSSVSTSLTCQNNTGHLSSQWSLEVWWLLGFMSCAGHMVNLKILMSPGSYHLLQL